MAQTKMPLFFPQARNLASQPRTQRFWTLPLTLLFLTECVILLVNAVLPLRGLWFYDALLAQLGSWSLFPKHLLFPRLQTMVGQGHSRMPISLNTTWRETYLLFGVFILLFLLYLLAVYILSRRVSWRYVMLSTLLLGATLALCPVVASQDIFSYILYARMEVFYHLNPFTNPPTTIHNDAAYPFVFWVKQSSLYGPTWILITSGIQELARLCGLTSVPSMVLLLRFFSLAMHLASTLLIWSIVGHVQGKNVLCSSLAQTRRVQATLAFAWNPALLFEACINAHSDTTVLFLLLLTLWLLLPRLQTTRYANFLAVVAFAAAICLKVNFLLLLPGFFLFVWTQRTYLSMLKRVINVAGVAVVCGITILLFYAPFLQHAQIIQLLLINPNTAHDANSLYEILVRFYAGYTHITIPSATRPTGIAIENSSHIASTILFLIVYAVLCVRALLVPCSINTLPALVRWMMLAWLAYCLLGTPWFWSWYMVTFFGLFALVEADQIERDSWLGFLRISLVARTLAFTLLSVYCFYTWAPHIALIHLFFNTPVLYLRGLWIWGPPLLVFCLYPFIRNSQRRSSQRTSTEVLPSTS